MAHLGGMIFGFFYLKGRNLNFRALSGLGRQYKEMKMRRAKKRFEVYNRKRDSHKHDRWVN